MIPYELTQRLYKAYKVCVLIEEAESGCWYCIDRKPGTHGYTPIRIDNKKVRLHRLVLNITSIAVEGIDTSHTLHSCDNRSCINPKHLRWGTQKDNSQDMVERERFSVCLGTNNHNSKLTLEMVYQIKETPRTRHTSNIKLAKKYGVSESQIGNIRNGKQWISAIRPKSPEKTSV